MDDVDTPIVAVSTTLIAEEEWRGGFLASVRKPILREFISRFTIVLRGSRWQTAARNFKTSSIVPARRFLL
jgi:hypothetical protein